jgi:hypothetical protein
MRRFFNARYGRALMSSYNPLDFVVGWLIVRICGGE